MNVEENKVSSLVGVNVVEYKVVSLAVELNCGGATMSVEVFKSFVGIDLINLDFWNLMFPEAKKRLDG